MQRQWKRRFSVTSTIRRSGGGMDGPRDKSQCSDSALNGWSRITCRSMTASCVDPTQRRCARLRHCTGRHEEDDLAMCGITGIFETRDRKEISRAVLTRMNESQHHRGPDEVGYLVEPGIGHRRLSIIAVATGQQPLFNEDGSVAVIYNGEIYNFQELIPELTALGH